MDESPLWIRFLVLAVGVAAGVRLVDALGVHYWRAVYASFVPPFLALLVVYLYDLSRTERSDGTGGSRLPERERRG